MAVREYHILDNCQVCYGHAAALMSHAAQASIEDLLRRFYKIMDRELPDDLGAKLAEKVYTRVAPGTAPGTAEKPGRRKGKRRGRV